MSLQTLADIAKDDDKLKRKAVKKLRAVMQNGSPAMKSRSKKLLKELGDD